MNKKIVGVFYTEHEASSAIEDLKARGFQTEDISVIARNKDDVESISNETGTKAPEGIASGAATGGVLGGVTGLLAGIGALAIPGIGPIIAAGPIAATLAGAAVGAGTGGLVGGLIGLGIPEDEAETYDSYVDEGRILVMVDADDSEAGQVYAVFRKHNSANSDRYLTDINDNTADTAGRSVNDTVDAAFNGSGLEGRHDTGLDTMNSAAQGVPETRNLADVDRPGMTGDAYSGTRHGMAAEPADLSAPVNDLEEDERKLRLREEQLDVSKNRVQTGEVNVRKEIVEEQKTINVPVSHEEIVIERRPVSGDTAAGTIGQEETIRIPVSEEKVEVSKNTVVTGEVDIHKREVQSTEQVKDTVKREEARVDKSGDVKVNADGELLRDHSRTR
ncbi:YsnF/AvaK domain-containing protein [Paenibacillus tengchongensis]|uniref:YsnF/AvaK domain-containing protein n=1 Tax=Paenibacillus tengchongensis TaxID=2608684 RepID=UPI00124EE3A4|nr:YsnF/AvaK domain-containing protein [Paenibacillus tengchongensis]